MGHRPRQLTAARIRELLDGMPTFDERIRRLGRTKKGQTPLQLPSAASYPAGGLMDVAAAAHSDDPEEVAFYRDVMRLQELFTYVHMVPGAPRAQVNAAIALLREQSASIVKVAGNAETAALYEAMIGSRLAELESITDEELESVARFAPEIEASMMRSAQARRAAPGKKKPNGA